METRSTSSHMVSATTPDLCRANHILSILLSLRRPARPLELATRCALFSAPPELIVYLCSIPNSPIALTSDLIVIPSPVAVRGFAESLASSHFFDAVSMPLRKRKRNLVASDYGFELPRKRRLIFSSEEVNEDSQAQPGLQCTSQMVHFDATECDDQNINRVRFHIEQMVNGLLFAASLSGNSSVGQFSHPLTNDRYMEGETSVSMLRNVDKDIGECERDPESPVMTSRLENLPLPGRASEDGMGTEARANVMPSFWVDGTEEKMILQLTDRNLDEKQIDPSFKITGEEIALEDQERENSVASWKILGGGAIGFLPLSDAVIPGLPNCDEELGMGISESGELGDANKEKTDRLLGRKAVPQTDKVTIAHKHSLKSSAKIRNFHMNAKSPRMKELCKSLDILNATDSKEKYQSKGDRIISDKNRRLKKGKHDGELHLREIKKGSTSIPTEDQAKQTTFPKFESYVVEEEEGSGGYGTVYRARRKNDGAIVAIKYPHAKAHKHHVYNEQRMLERFGGKNFIIKYEGCIQSEDSDCFVLEHVEHDRPEVLKKEIDIGHLRWYAYCMFRALASLHKQGIVHRDVKPGNFLFSRKTSKGYLIDFNLAMDLFQNSRNRNDGKSMELFDIQNNHVKPSSEKCSQTKDRKLPNPSVEATNPTAADLKNLRISVLAQTSTRNNDTGSWNLNKSQGTDGSAITSGDRMREPFPSQGRKELLSLVQKARQSQNREASTSILSPMRKRVVAPSQDVDNALRHLTPMPIVGARIPLDFMNKGNGKAKRDGPCAGTKGFRAPEVLLRSLFQGPKVDLWSAGVTLLYLVIGRTPFLGDPDQNMKDIAKLRGSEDLWEVAKLHNRESSLPKDLYKTESLPSTKLLDWCETNTRKPDFLKEIPRSLVDLVEKCLTVNPRRRITAEEALNHDFFAPCHEALKRQRLQRQVLCQEAGNSYSLRGKTVLQASKTSQVKQ